MPPTLDYMSNRSNAGGNATRSDWRWLRWWIPSILLFFACALCDPAGEFRTGSHAYTILSRISVMCFELGVASIPAIIVIRIGLAVWRWARAG
jgi:hypothetical protein